MSNTNGHIGMSPSAGMSRIRCRRTPFLPGSAAQATAIAIWRVRFLADDWYWDPLAGGQNVLPGKHAYSHVNAMSSAMQAYFVLGSEKHLRAAAQTDLTLCGRRVLRQAAGDPTRNSGSRAAARSAKA